MKFISKPRFVGARFLTVAALLAGVGSSPAQSVLQGLAAYLNFDNNLDAQAGTTNSGAIYGQSADPNAKYVSGIAGQAVSFNNDGSSGQPSDWAITLGKMESIYSNNFSYSLWVQTSSTVDAALFGNKDWTSGANVGWCVNTTSGKNLNWNAAGGSRRDINLNPPFSDGNWHLATVTWNRTANVVSVYLDGALSITSDISPDWSASMNAGFPTLVGGSGSGKYSATGNIDDLGIWTRVLAPEEIAAVYGRGMNGVPLVNSSAPFFAQQPAGGTRYASDFFELTCLLADDRGPANYQWHQGGNPVAGATNSSLLLTNLTAGNFSYTVVANDGMGSITSAPAALTVLSSSHITNGLEVYLNFDNNMLPQGPTTNSGTAIGNDPNPKYVPGPIGNAVTFANDGSGSYTPTDWAVSFGDIEYVYSNSWSFSLWVNLTNNLDGALLGNKDWTSGSDVGWVFAPYNTTEINYYSTSGPRRDLGGVSVRDGNWHHVVAVFNRDANSSFVYVDGNQVAAASLGFSGFESLTPTAFSPNDTLVGSSGPGTYSGAGSVDDLGIWSRSLTASEVLAIYSQGLNGQPLTTAVAGSAVRPSISSQPQSLTVFENRNAQLSVTAAGSSPLTYQWYQNGATLADATNSVLSFAPATTNDTGSYAVAVRNSVGAVTSAPPAILTVLPITSIASGLAVYLNFESSILAQAGTTNNGTAIGTDATEKYTAGIVGSYAAIFNNDGSGGISTDWAVSLGDIEWIYGGSWAFSLWVNATNANDGAILGNKDWTSGADVGWELDPSRLDALNYTTAGNTRRDIGTADIIDGHWHHVTAVFDRDANLVSYYVDGHLSATNSLSNLGSESLTPATFSPNATLVGSSGNDIWSAQGAVDDLGIWYRTLGPDEILAIYAQGLKGQPLTTAVAGSAVRPLISTQPQSLTLAAGFSAALSVTASGTAPLGYQWFMNGALLSGQTNSTLPLPFVTPANAGSYAVVVSNLVGTVTSAPPAVLTVIPPATSLTDGLVVYLDFETNLLAKAGTTNSGVAIGTVGVETYTNGVIGSYAASFNNDGSANAAPSDWAVSLGNIEWIYAGDWSFSIWVKTTDTLGAFLGNKDWSSGSNIGWLISEYYSQFLNYKAVNGPRYDIGPATSWADDNWHHISAVFYRDANTVYAYVDGAPAAQAPLSTTGFESLTPTDINTTLVGSSGNGAYSSYGQIDDLGIWTRPLSQAEVIGIYQAGASGSGIPEAKTGAPTLSVSVANNGLTLTYPAWASGYTLESSPALSPASWTPVKSTPVIAGANATVTVPLSPASRFFRLQN
jgi:hypothetical protein